LAAEPVAAASVQSRVMSKPFRARNILASGKNCMGEVLMFGMSVYNERNGEIPEGVNNHPARPNVVFMIGSKLLLEGRESGDPILECSEK
jgi:hypothetical protein